jgi:type II secretory ATPase GspE/PulE/Tfp pilus assembly ATPase PilB-like protein
MYAMLNEIDLMTRNVITVEDPIEYILPNASQIEVNTKAGITFAKSLRSILRQDPDVICVGEIRDEDTAAIALRAAQTGHLVFATIHSNSNSSAIVRLLDLGVSPLMISAGLNLVMSQRLLRQLCDDCKVKAELSASEIEYFRHRKVNYGHIYGPGGCARCNETGYYDRMAVCDMLVMTDQIRGKIANDVRLINELRKSGDKKGASNIHKQGVLRAVQGLTSMAEIKRVIG